MKISQLEAETTQGPKISMIQPNFTFPKRTYPNDEVELNKLAIQAIPASEILVIPETSLQYHYFNTKTDNKISFNSYGFSWLRKIQGGVQSNKLKYILGGVTVFTDEENPALDNKKYRENSRYFCSNTVGAEGIEPPTFSLKGCCSTV